LLRGAVAVSEGLDEAVQVGADSLHGIARLNQVVFQKIAEHPIAAATKKPSTQPIDGFPHHPTVFELPRIELHASDARPGPSSVNFLAIEAANADRR
jgi:hypothetical protein